MPRFYNASVAGSPIERTSKANNKIAAGAGWNIKSLQWLSWLVSPGNRSVTMSSITAGVAALTLRLLLIPFYPLPKPAVGDEFSYLLGADTFVHRRLANPMHPLWVHFEAYNILSHPTYASRYPPGQSLVLALGMFIHAPWLAVWLSTAALCGLITWASWGWLGPRWAIAGGILAALQLTGSYWTESYWGGSVAAIGGALVVGGLARLLRQASRGPAMLFGLGLVILGNTRPFEGFVLGALAFAIFAVHSIRRLWLGSETSSHLVLSIGLPLASVLLPAFIWMGYYNYRVTGHSLLMPSTLYAQQYESWPAFLWSGPRPEPHFNHDIFRAFSRNYEAPRHRFLRQHYLVGHLGNLIELYRFFLGPALFLAILISLNRLIRDRLLRIPLALLTLFYLSISFEVNTFPHYVAPATALIFLVAIAAIRTIASRFPPGRPRFVSICAMFICIAVFDGHRLMNPVARYCYGRDLREFLAQRERVLAFLDRQPGRQLVLVRYGPHHGIENEWVYNEANIDQARIVWARAMPDCKDDELLHYYPDRRVWILDDDAEYVENGKEPQGKITLSPG
jgi:hypothetical protein